MRVLIDRGGAAHTDDLTDDDLAALYAVPALPWLRANMVSTVDGAATGADGRTGSINNAADKRVFDLLRRMADAIVVGAGTARIEGYGPTNRPLVLVSRRGILPPGLLQADPGSVLMATCSQAAGLDDTRRDLGVDNVLVLGDDEVDLTVLKQALVARGMTNLLCEGGPSLLSDLLRAGQVDELCVTQVPELIGGVHRRIAVGTPVGESLELRLLIETDGTLMCRWVTAGTG